MSKRDDWGYPLTDVLAERYHGPLAMRSDASEQLRVAHEAAYAAYQERFRVAYMAKVKRRSAE